MLTLAFTPFEVQTWTCILNPRQGISLDGKPSTRLCPICDIIAGAQASPAVILVLTRHPQTATRLNSEYATSCLLKCETLEAQPPCTSFTLHFSTNPYFPTSLQPKPSPRLQVRDADCVFRALTRQAPWGDERRPWASPRAR